MSQKNNRVGRYKNFTDEICGSGVSNHKGQNITKLSNRWVTILTY